MSEAKNKVLTEWVNSHADYLFERAFYKGQDKDFATDIVQDTFLAAINAYEKFESKSSVKTWLTSILNNKIIDYFRKSSKSFLSLDQLTERNSDSFTESFFDETDTWKQGVFEEYWHDENLLDNYDFINVLESCLTELTNNWRAIILSKYIENKDAAEICKEFNISNTNYWQIIHRTKLLLRKCINSKWSN